MRRKNSSRRTPFIVARVLFWFFVSVTILVGVSETVVAAPDVLIQAANRASTEYRENLQKLAEWAQEKGLREEARKTRAQLGPESDDRIFIPSFPLDIGTLDLPRGLPAVLPREYAEFFILKGKSKDETDAEAEVLFRNEKSAEKSEKNQPRGRILTDREVWQIQFRTVRQNYARRLAGMAKNAVKKDRGTLAVQMAIAGLQADPDHAAFRNVFGFTKYKAQWRTAWEADRLKKGFVDHEIYGWIPKKAVSRYENGERFCAGNWVSLTEANQIHGRAVEAGWRIQSEHYDLMTNHSLEEGVRLVRLLENFYRVWKLVFFRYMASDEQLASLFDGKSASVPLRRHRVFLYRDREDFVRSQQSETKLDASQFAGFYRHRGNEGACYFYAVEANAPEWQRHGVVRTMYHEATHQLFCETRQTISRYGSKQNFWLVEGVATFMESMHPEGEDYFAVGGSGDSRLRGARQLGVAMPIDDFCRLDYNGFIQYPQLNAVYSQAAALFHFLFFHEQGTWQDAMIVYLRQVYSEKDDPATLRKLTGMSYTELDKLFKEFLDRR